MELKAGSNPKLHHPLYIAMHDPDVIKLFSYSTQLSTKFILLINVKMPTIVGILTFITMINTSEYESKKIHFFSTY